MAKSKDARVAGQKSIASFFGGGSSSTTKGKKPAAKTKKVEQVVHVEEDEDEPLADTESDYVQESSGEEAEDLVEDEEVAVSDVGASDVEMEEEEEKPAKKPRAEKRTKAAAIDTSELPPIHDISAIFLDLVSRASGSKEVVEKLTGRKLRVATMCSGTESPLLSLEEARRAIKTLWDLDFQFEHVFSCEIEPFKQAYIERNFSPPLLFRDVCELGSAHAHTAYGSLAPVPGDVDLLIAGTSCVDYSNLNNEKQDIDGHGESGRTFRGMLDWVDQHRPPLVILENVCSAPWTKVVEYFRQKGYAAQFARVDTKNYYIPHTRTRVYLLAVNMKNSDLPEKWLNMVTKLRRPASSTLDAFLLPSDDPRIHQAREKLVRESYNGLDRRTGRMDWGRCESRHQRARLEEELGSARPLTHWNNAGFCKLPDFAWNDWGIGQVERVWDLMDISLLRSAKEGVDPSYKTVLKRICSLVWNLSQNVDRTIGSSRPGICPCLTPSMIPYLTNRGGPMVGLEALSMQGLPVDELLLTRETEDQLADLAGNAMSTTVVGACILAALIVGKKLLKDGSDTTTYEQKRAGPVLEEEDDVQDVLMNIDKLDIGDSLDDHISGDAKLKEKPLDLSARAARPLSAILADAAKSARLCECEGRKDMTSRQLRRCQNCGSTSCVRCGGYPEHKLEEINLVENPRMPPSDFERELKASLPMAIVLSNITQGLLDELRAVSGADISSSLWKKWSSAVVGAAAEELHFTESKRQEIWSVVYQSPSAQLELLLHPQRPEWRFFARPSVDEPVHSEVRTHLESSPAGRFVCKDGLLEGNWEFGLPCKETVSVTVNGDKLGPSWEAELGLTGEEFKDKKVYSQLEVAVADEDVQKLERDISGTYVLHDKCGMANASLHRKVATPEENDLPPIFLFLDPSRTGKGEDDSFVFSITRKRCEYGETRPIICTVDSEWRQSSTKGPQTVECKTPCKWMKSSKVAIIPAPNRNAVFAVPSDILKVELSNESCRSATALLTCRVPLPGQTGTEWPIGTWREVDKVHERGTFKALAWLTERVRSDNHFEDWQEAHLHGSQEDCERCAPTPPGIKWAKNDKRKIVAIEDTAQAGAYERALKRRPAPFVTQLKLDGDGIGHVRIGVNIASLMHRAMSRLPTAGRTEPVTVAWRLNSNFSPMAVAQLTKFQLLSNRHDESHSQPPSFKTPLRPEQLRSLTWMLRQESADAPPFMEEEISEAILHPLGWRVEGRAQRPHRVRGGVLADEVGYGKTAITLGLIDCAAKDVQREYSELDDKLFPGKVAVKGTLVIVPPHLTGQWESECRKFAGKRFKIVNIATASNLNSTSVEDITESDIIIVASNLFRSGVYLENLADFSASGGLPEKQEGRYFDARLNITLDALQKQVDRLKSDKGPELVLSKIRAALKKGQDEDQLIVQTKRLKGKSYRDKAMAQESTTKKVKPVPPAGKASVRNGLQMEVVLPPLSKSLAGSSIKRSTSSKADTTADEVSDRPVTRKALPKRKFVVTSDDDDDEPAPSSKKKTAQKGKGEKQDSSDYEEESSDVDVHEMEVDAVIDSDDAIPPLKNRAVANGKGKAVPKGKTKASASTSSAVSESEATDGMDIDEPAGSKGKGKGKGAKSTKKRRTSDSSDVEDEDTKRPAKKARKPRRGEADPWKLGSTAVKREWSQMKAPPLEMFHFARKVVDEYTYLEGRTLSMITRLTAQRHWVLSGTPPTADFGSLKTISAFLNIHLGVNDDGEGDSAKKRKREQTDVEKFHSFREVHSLEWHAHRNELGQAFLNQFVRQNIAEIDEIVCTHMIEKVKLPAAERAIYLELDHHLKALDMTVKRGKKTESDREKRMALVLGESGSAEEALLKRCAHFDLQAKKDNAMKACEIIVGEREAQMEDCKAEYSKLLKKAVQQEKEIGKITVEESLFQEHARVLRANQTTDGDEESTQLLVGLLDDAKVPTSNLPPKAAKGAKGVPTVNHSEKQKAKMWEHREQTHEIRRVAKELVGRMRSLRYFRAVRDLQKPESERLEVSCPKCGREALPIEDISISSTCGHMGCNDCVKAAATSEHCINAMCRCNVKLLNVIKASSLGVDDVRDGKRKHYGKKLEEVIDLIKNRIPADERVLIFVQFPDLMKKVGEALEAHRIKFLEIKGSASVKSNNLLKYQNDASERVLLLNVMDESASGANLTGANHAIFLSPLLAQTQEQYTSCETQAIGRVRRYGQTKHVRIWRFFSLDTIDTEILEQRTGHDVDGNPVQA
ncbi:hypothetical protein BC835DRAFT_1303658 [Cytidiella melzeri]|nr:hypothetical protein BC835DRAFT_1303658 [Cytidiella melzeri]